MKTYTSPACLLALAWWLGATPASHAATLVVTNLADSGPGSLRQAIADAGTGDNITFATNGTIVLATHLNLTGKTLTITGPGSGSLAINGNGSDVVIRKVFGWVTISGLTITNGHGTVAGGIWQSSGSITLIDSVLAGNSVSNPSYTRVSGGIVNEGGSVTISNSNLFGNAVSFTNSLPDIFTGGGIYNNASGSVTIIDSILSSNSVSCANAKAGGIYNEGSLTIIDSILSGNSANENPTQDGFGGGIYNSGDKGDLVMSGSILSGNSARWGGGIYAANKASLTITDSSFPGNLAHQGGAIYSHSATNTLNHCTLTSNSVVRIVNAGTQPLGGAI